MNIQRASSIGRGRLVEGEKKKEIMGEREREIGRIPKQKEGKEKCGDGVLDSCTPISQNE